jgi:hypothetical protein
MIASTPPWMASEGRSVRQVPRAVEIRRSAARALHRIVSERLAPFCHRDGLPSHAAGVHRDAVRARAMKNPAVDDMDRRGNRCIRTKDAINVSQ